MFYLDFLNLNSKFLQAAVAIDAVGDIIPEAMPHHSFPVSFPDAVSLTDAAEGMAGRSGAFYYKILLDFYLKICIIKVGIPYFHTFA